MSPLEKCECSILLTSGKKEAARHDAGLRRRSGASFGSALFSYALWQPNHSGRRTVDANRRGIRTTGHEQERLTGIGRSPMFQELIDDYRRQAEQYIADAIKLESGDADQSSTAAAGKRGLAAMLFGLADAYEEQDR